MAAVFSTSSSAVDGPRRVPHAPADLRRGVDRTRWLAPKSPLGTTAPRLGWQGNTLALRDRQNGGEGTSEFSRNHPHGRFLLGELLELLDISRGPGPVMLQGLSHRESPF